MAKDREQRQEGNEVPFPNTMSYVTWEGNTRKGKDCRRAAAAKGKTEMSPTPALTNERGKT